jgi:RNA polymerase sigma-70 factor, ECF subfamily
VIEVTVGVRWTVVTMPFFTGLNTTDSARLSRGRSVLDAGCSSPPPMTPAVGTGVGAVSGRVESSSDEVTLDDVTLVVRAREGDVRAYEQLVRRYQGPIFRVAVRMLASRGDAEDVVQEVFLTAWRSLGSLHEEAAFVGWLYRMVTNRCLNVLRARRATVDVDLAQRESRGAGSRPERTVEVSEQLAAVTVALQRLTGEQRACWLLREVHGRSYEEIAQAVGVTTTAVRGRIARARAQLTEMMAPWR